MIKRITKLLFFVFLVAYHSSVLAQANEIDVPAGLTVEFQPAGYYSSRYIKPNTEVDIVAVHDVKYNDKVVIHAGARGIGLITMVSHARGCGKKGVMEIKPLSITAVDGKIFNIDGLPYRAVGYDKKGLVYGLTCGGFFLLGPFSLLFLMLRGENALLSPVLTLKGFTSSKNTITIDK